MGRDGRPFDDTDVVETFSDDRRGVLNEDVERAKGLGRPLIAEKGELSPLGFDGVSVVVGLATVASALASPSVH